MRNVIPKISRRSMLAMLSASATLSWPSWVDAKSTEASLAHLVMAKGLRFGSAVSAAPKGGFTDPQMAELLIRECNLIVPENELKMYVTHNQPDSYDFKPADEMLAFCNAHHIAMRGHNLIWAKDKYTPAWLVNYDFGDNAKTTAEKMLREYITTVVNHYGTQLTSWDVVNESVDEKTGEVRSSVWVRELGIDALRIAFEQTRELLPGTQLVYNDYMSWDANDAMHRAGVLKLLRWFRENKVPVDALGVQSHLNSAFELTPEIRDQWKQFLDAVVAMGYDLLITEMDMNDKTVAGDIVQRDAVTAKVARGYLDQMMDYKQLKDVLVWGICDKYNWLRGIVHRPDGLPVRSTLYDDNFKPKPMRDAFAAAFKTAAHR